MIKEKEKITLKKTSKKKMTMKKKRKKSPTFNLWWTVPGLVLVQGLIPGFLCFF